METQTRSPFIRTKYACFLTSLSTAVTGNLPALLFLTFRECYGISYSQIGFLVVLYFVTQLSMDLTFSFFGKHIKSEIAVRFTPAVILFGLLFYAASPLFFVGNEYLGISLGTVFFALGSGLAEVLTSPVVVALPLPGAKESLGLLHASYAGGVVFTVLFSTGFLVLFGRESWQILTLILSILPLAATVLMMTSPMPVLTKEEEKKAPFPLKNPLFVLSVLLIFFGGAAECAMAQWCSSYAETVFGLGKTVGDLVGAALFGLMLFIGRIYLSKKAKNVLKLLTFGFFGAFACYLLAAVCDLPVVGLVACGMTGLFASPLWPGSLMVMEEDSPHIGVTGYAFMASGGDLGAAFAPQAIGLITDYVLLSGGLPGSGAVTDGSAMQSGMLIASLFPLLGGAVCIALAARRKKRDGVTENKKIQRKRRHTA